MSRGRSSEQIMSFFQGILNVITEIIFTYQKNLLAVLLSTLVMLLTLESTIDIGKQYVSILGSFQTPIKAVGGLMCLTLGTHYLPQIYMDQAIALILYLGPWISTGLIVAGYSFAVGNAVTDWSYINDGFKVLYGASATLIIIGIGFWVITGQIPEGLPNLLNGTQYHPEPVLNASNSSNL